MVQLENTPGRACIINKEEFLFFSGYAYLGMNHVKKFTDLVKEGIDKYGVLFPSSRISNTRLKLYKKFELQLSAITGMPDTVSFSSGYLAGKTIADILSSHKNILVAPASHPAVAIPSSQKINSTNFNEWGNEVAGFINASTEKDFVLIADSVDILKAQVHNFSFVKNIYSSKKIFFLIDDSHGIGILGKTGEGIIAQLPKKENIEYIISFSLSKAFNIEGGAVSCSKKFTAKLRLHPNYTGSTPISPSLMHAFIKSKKLYRLQQQKLIKNISYFKKHAQTCGVHHNFDLPIFICKNENSGRLLYKENIIISSFGYPDASSQKINRIVLNALHTKKDIKKLCKGLQLSA